MSDTAKEPAKPTAIERRRVLVAHLHQVELADRWRISPRTLERWRWLKQGPAYVKIGGRVIYLLEDVVAYEVSQRRNGHAGWAGNGHPAPLI